MTLGTWGIYLGMCGVNHEMHLNALAQKCHAIEHETKVFSSVFEANVNGESSFSSQQGERARATRRETAIE